jgi:hypothetical protein
MLVAQMLNHVFKSWLVTQATVSHMQSVAASNRAADVSLHGVGKHTMLTATVEQYMLTLTTPSEGGKDCNQATNIRSHRQWPEDHEPDQVLVPATSQSIKQ